MSKHVHPKPRITARIALRVLTEVILTLPVRPGKRAAQ